MNPELHARRESSPATSLPRPLLVQKYGGSSVATAEHMKNVARRVADRHRRGNAVVVVVSAMGKTTDSLVTLAREITLLPERREMDMLLHAGEIISSSILAMAIAAEGVPSISLTGSQAGMLTDASHTEARIREVKAERVLSELAAGRVVVIAGFQGQTETREITTLGRGGSDTSAVAMAVGLGAKQCEILTDVDGVYTADPRIVERPRMMRWCSYDEMLELAILGAKVLHSRSVEIARRFDMPVLVATSFKEAPGTLICSRERAEKEFGVMENVSIRGFAQQRNVAKVSILGVPDRPGIAAQVFSTIGREDINILLIVQAEHHGGRNDLSFLVPSDTVPRLLPLLDDLVKAVGGERAVTDEGVATVSIVGEGIKREPGIAARMFNALAQKNINIDLITTSNLMITCVIPESETENGVRALHDEFVHEAAGAAQTGEP